MSEVRLMLAVLLFCLSTYLVIDLFIHCFDAIVLLAAVAGYVMVHWLVPDKRQFEEADWANLLIDILDFPFKATASLLRSLGGRDAGDGFD